MFKSPEKRTALTATTLASFLTTFMGSSVNIALPVMGGDLRLDGIMLSWVTASYLLASAMFLIPFGRIADIYGRKRVFITGIVLFTLAALFSGMAGDFRFLLACRVLNGAGSAMIFATAVAIVSSIFPPKERGHALGINTAAVYIGLSAGPFLGGLLTHYLGWRSIFFSVALSGAGVTLFAAARLKGEWAESRHETFDLAGSLLYGISLASLMYGLSSVWAPAAPWLIAVGAAGLGLFVLRQSRARHPVLDIPAFRRNTVFILSNIAALVNYSATFGVSFLLSLYLQFIKGLSPQAAGLVLVAQPVMQALFSPMAGKMSDTVEPRLIASVGMGFTAAGLAVLAFMTAGTGIGTVTASLLLLGFGFALFSSPNTNAIMGSVERRQYDIASSTLATMRLVGQMLSMAVTMLLFSLNGLGNAPITPSRFDGLVDSTRSSFLIFTVLCIGGVFASLARGPVRKKEG